MLTENTETTQTQKANNHTKIRNENKILQQQNKQLRDQMEVLHKSIEEREERFQEAQTIAKAGTTNQPNDDLQTLINERFDKIEENIDHFISTKRAENMQTMEVKDVEVKVDAAIHQTKSYATTLQTALEASNLTNIRKETKNEERVHK